MHERHLQTLLKEKGLWTEDWPRDEAGNYLCTPERPAPKDRPSIGLQWMHTAAAPMNPTMQHYFYCPACHTGFDTRESK